MSQNSHTSCHCGGHACDCCTGPSVLTPEPIHNVSGLTTLRRRTGTWDSFRQSMIARLSEVTKFPALAGLRTRETDDASIAMLDAAAVVGDVLTFYQERLANEGYLGTATERRSLTELGKLVGYRPRPGVSASAWLAFSLDEGYAITIPAGTRVQSVPGSPEESAQTFETSSDLAARAELNLLRPRPGIPQEISPANVINVETIWLEGIGLNLKPGDLLLFVFPTDEAASTPRKIHAVAENAAAARTTVNLVVEKLSAAYYLSVLRKAAQAMRQSIPEAWVTSDTLWAKNAAASLDNFTAGLGADTSLLGIEGLFPAPDASHERGTGLDAALAATVIEGDVAGGFTTGLTARAGWAESLITAWRKILTDAAAQEELLAKIFAKLTTIDDNVATVETRKSAAQEIVELVDHRPPDVVPAATTALRNLRTLAANASTVTTAAAWDRSGLGPAAPAPARLDFDKLGLEGPALEARTDAMDFLADREADLEAAKLATVTGRLLDGGDSSFKKHIDDAPPEVAGMLLQIKERLAKVWTDLEDVMTVPLTAGAAKDEALLAIAKGSSELVANLEDTDGNHRRRAVDLLAEASGYEELFGDAATGNRGILATIDQVGNLADALESHRDRFREESVEGLRRSILLLEGRYRKLPQDTDGRRQAAAELVKLRAIASLPTAGLEEMHAVLSDALVLMKKVLEKDTDAVLQRLDAEMRILNGQISVSPSGAGATPAPGTEASAAALGSIVSGNVLLQPAAPGSPLAVPRSLDAFLPSGNTGAASDAVSRLAGRLAGSTDDDLFAAWRKLNTGTPAVEVHAMRVQSAVFGSGAPMRFGTAADKSFDARFSLPAGEGDWTPDVGDLGQTIRLDGEHGKVVRDGWIIIERPVTVQDKEGGQLAAVSTGRQFEIGAKTLVRRIGDVSMAPHSAYSLSGKATTVTLVQEDSWGEDDLLEFGVIRRAKVHAASELLKLAEMPVVLDTGFEATPDAEGRLVRSTDNPFAENRDVLLLDGLYQGLAPGHRLLISGERVNAVSARQVREYALVSNVEHVLTPAAADPSKPLPGDTPHTRLTLSKDLQYVYRRETVVIHGNVAEATHGETKREVLGSGNARAAGQKFPLRSVPVTHIPAATAKGAASTVQLRVDRVLWKEADQFTDTKPDERIYVLEITDDGGTHVVFGDGEQGARLPTGSENVTAVYRSGIGRGGNVRPESLSTLLDRPLGLKGVANPLPASGGADRDGPEDIRRNAPLPLMALDRLVSTSDYAAFSRAFAGIGKAESAVLGGAGGSFVHVTVAGQNDAPLDETSALLASLTEALVTLGDPMLPVRVQPRELLVLMLAAKVRIDADREWAAVEPAIRSAVLAAFGFARREPGQDVFLSEVISVIQSVPGVDFVDVDSFAGIPQKRATDKGRIPLTPTELEAAVRAGLAEPPGRLATELAGYDEFRNLRPAQIALFLPDMPETLILNQLVS